MADETTSPKISLDMYTSIPISGMMPSATPVNNNQPLSSSMPDNDTITRMANVYDLDPDVILRQIQQESGGNPKAVSKKGAQGVMQLMPDTAAALGVKDPFDPVQNIDGGMRLMSRLLGKYNGDYSKALAAYDSGEPNVDKAGGIPDIDETKNYVNSILKGTKYEVKPPTKPINQPSGLKLDMSTSIPITKPSSQPSNGQDLSLLSSPGRFATDFNQSFGIPPEVSADITKFPQFTRQLWQHLITGPVPKIGGGAELANIPINVLKDAAVASQEARQKAVEDYKNAPDLDHKAGAALMYITGSVPFIGPAINKSVESFDKGDYAGGLGTLTGTALQILSGSPEARESAAAHLDMAGKYLFSKPRVQETILAGETKEMLTAAEETARKRVIAMAPKYSDLPPVPGAAVSDIAEKALNDNIHGISATPKPIADILQENPAKFKRLGAVETPGGDLMDIFTRMSSNQPTSMADLHDYYTKLGEYGSKDLPGNVYNAVKETRNGIGKLIDGQYKMADPDPVTGANRSDQWEDFRKAFSDMHKHWWDNDSPLYQSLHANDPTAILRPLVGDSKERAADYLGRYIKDGADPNAVKAANTLAKGMNQMQLRGLLQASGGLLASYMLRSEGASAQVGAGIAGSLLTGRLIRGYFRTRPSLTNLLAEAAEKPTLGKQLPPLDLSGLGNRTPFGPSGGGNSGGNGPGPEPAPIAPLPVDHSSSTITPTEGQFISSIANTSNLHPDLKADLQAISKEVMAQTPNERRSTIRATVDTSAPPDPIRLARMEQLRQLVRNPNIAPRDRAVAQSQLEDYEANPGERNTLGDNPSQLKKPQPTLSREEAEANVRKRAEARSQRFAGGQPEPIPTTSTANQPESAMTVNPSKALPINLPHDLAGSKPKYGYQSKLFDLQFPDDVTKALYTVAQTTENKAHGRFMSYLRQVFPGKSDAAIIAKGKEVRASIKPIAATGNPDEGALIVPAAGSIQ